LCAAAVAVDPLIVAEELRYVRLAFDRLTGRAHVEAVLDALFGQFCIGK
jgi:tRNA modification GTPase